MTLSKLLCATTLCLTASYANADVVRLGTVLMSEPFYETQTTSEPREVCKKVDVPIYEVQTIRGKDDAGAFIGGAVIGGIIGNVIKQNGAGAALGAVIGGAVANETQKNNHAVTKNVIVGYRKETKCKTHYTKVSSQVIVGYRTVVEIYELGQYRFDFISEKMYIPGEKVQIQLNPQIH